MSEVIRQFKQKVDDSTYSSPIFLGAYPQYVGALRHSNNANLEEQYILGTDCVTTESWELDENSNMVHKIIKEFHDGSQEEPVDYYKLVSKIYDEVSDYEVDEQTLIFGSKANAVEGKVLVLSFNHDVNNKILTLDSTNGGEVESELFSSKRETLSYIDKNKQEIKISTKVTTQTHENDIIVTKAIITREKNINVNS